MKTNLMKIDKSYKVLYENISSKYGKDKAKGIFKNAEEELKGLYLKYKNISKGEKCHTDKYIFPRVAVYRAMKTELGEDAMPIMDGLIKEEGAKVSRLMHSISVLPFMKKPFLKIFKSMAKNQFGEAKGFKQKFYDTPKTSVKFDILDCPYCRYCRLCDCPELIHTFCDSDAYCFGNLSKITFVREETLENGEKCDFTLSIE